MYRSDLDLLYLPYFYFQLVVIIRSFSQDNAALALTVVNPDLARSSWARSKRLMEIALLYRKAGTSSWNSAKTDGGQAVTFPFSVTLVCCSF